MDGPTNSDRDADELLRDADRARDSQDWTLAEMLYAAFLELRPEAWGIRVQQGHCRKERGEPAAALELYREAERDAPDDADLQLQIGHALKLLGRLDEAEAAYARATSLDPGRAAARQELIAIRRRIAIEQALQPALQALPLSGPAEVAKIFESHQRLPTTTHSRGGEFGESSPPAEYAERLAQELSWWLTNQERCKHLLSFLANQIIRQFPKDDVWRQLFVSFILGPYGAEAERSYIDDVKKENVTIDCDGLSRGRDLDHQEYLAYIIEDLIAALQLRSSGRAHHRHAEVVARAISSLSRKPGGALPRETVTREEIEILRTASSSLILDLYCLIETLRGLLVSLSQKTVESTNEQERV